MVRAMMEQFTIHLRQHEVYRMDLVTVLISTFVFQTPLS